MLESNRRLRVLQSDGFNSSQEDLLSTSNPKTSVDIPVTSSPTSDSDAFDKPLGEYDSLKFNEYYVQAARQTTPSAEASIPPKPPNFDGEYLLPMLASDERMRLSALWYHIRGLQEDAAAQARIHHKVALVKQIIGWEYAICGLLDITTFERIAAAGMSLGLVPRKESPCSHTVVQAANSILFLPDMKQDWRFESAPCVGRDGLRAYAGVGLRCNIQDGQPEVALGSLCIASNESNKHLTQDQLDILVQFGRMVTDDIVNASRQRRMKQQKQNDILLAESIAKMPANLHDCDVLDMLHQVYDSTTITLSSVEQGGTIIRAGHDDKSIIQNNDEQCWLWEDDVYIDSFIRTQNHKASKEADHIVRAIVSRVLDDSNSRVLVVATKDISRMFDDVDVRFVTSCALLLSNIAKEKALKQALIARETFLRGVTHQLRTPIHGILGAAELIQTAMVSPPDKPQDSDGGHAATMLSSIEMIQDSGKQLLRSVNNMIRYNHWTVPSQTPSMAYVVDLHTLEMQILQDIPWDIVKSQLRHICIYFERQLPHGLALVLHDESLLRDCLQPLVLNAIQHTQRGSLVIAYSASPDFSSITFDVHDSGCGIALEDQQRIFEHYEKVDNSKTGAGLGLSLARKTAQVLNGDVSLISSELGKGSHFRATFGDQTFASLAVKPPLLDQTALDALPKHYYVVGDDTACNLTFAFVQRLKAHGLTESNDIRDALGIVPYADVVDRYDSALDQAAAAFVSMSLVPNQSGLAKAEAGRHSTLFFACPFTSARLDEILIAVNAACKERRCRLAPPQREQSLLSQAPLSLAHLTLQAPVQENTRSLAPHCLNVDDNPINLRILCAFCQQRGLPFKKAIDGLEAVEQYKAALMQTRINMILLDLQMPVCDGLEACNKIRELELVSGVAPAVIIIVTGQDTPEDRRDAAAAGANGYLVKPFSLKDLDRIVARHFPNESRTA